MKKSKFAIYRSDGVRAAGAGLSLAALLSFSGSNVRAGEGLAKPFTPGNIVVEKVGDGSAALSSAGTPILFDEITTSGALVQTFGIPTFGSIQLVESGSASSDGSMTLSADGKSLVFPGYATNSGTAGVTSATAAAVPRGIGRVDAYGNYTLPVTSTLAFSGNNIRGAASDGNNNYWASGTGSSSNYGIYYFGSASPAADLYSANIRSMAIYNGSLWYSTASSTGLGYGISEFTGEPVATATPTKIIALASTNGTYNFSVNPAGNTLYYADDGDESTGAAGIVKWTYSAGAWSKAYYVNTNPCFGLLVDWTTTPATIYATTGSGVASNSVIKLQDNGANSASTVLLTTGSANQMYRGLSFVPTNTAQTAVAPIITGLSPTNSTVSPGTNVTFTLFGTAGIPTATSQWYRIYNGTTNAITGATGGTLTLTNVNSTNTAGYFAIAANAYGYSTSSVASLTVIPKPTIAAISPASATNNAGTSVTFALTYTPGVPTATNLWYKIAGGATNLVAGQTNASLTLNNVLHGDAGGYFAILTNSSGSATSAVATLTVTNDPNIISGPSSAFGLLGGTVQFNVSVAATSPSYAWYYSDAGGNPIAPVTTGTLPTGTYAYGTSSGTLTLTNLHAADPTNFVVVVSNAYGSVTSSVASLLSVTNQAVIAFWNFNQPNFAATLNSPAPWFGAGTASYFNCSIESGVASPDDAVGTGGISYVPYSGLGATNNGWATYNYPLNNVTNSALASNKLCGVQFSLSTVGARNIMLTYESRVTQTASYYERLQYTTNGSTWIDYPASSSFNGNDGSGAAGYNAFGYDLTGFPGVDNNPNFGVRIVTEFQDTATYGLVPNTNYFGAGPPEPYGFGGTSFSGGTVTYDLVTFSASAITNSSAAPVISSLPNTNSLDYVPVTNYFTVTGGATPPDALAYNAVALDTDSDVYGISWPVGFTPFGINPTFTFGGSGANRYLIVNPNTIPDEVDASPILVTVYDPATGATAATSFLLTLQSVNLAPTNSLTSLPATNLLANNSVTIPFAVSDDRTPVSGLSYSVASDNNTLIPAGNIVVNNQGTANPSVTITPASNQVGVAVISVIVNDNDAQEPRSTTANLALTVRPNTNVVALDYFDYDYSGPLEVAGTNFWTHLSGNARTLQYVSAGDQPLFGNGYAVVDTLDYTENLQAPLLGAPYATNSSAVPALYLSFLANLDPNKLPFTNGSYFMVLNDGSGNTADIEGRILAATNGATPGYYRIGAANLAASAAGAGAQLFPMDLLPGSNYTVVARLVLSNGFTTVWINPLSAASPSVTDTTSVGTNLFNISDVELRQSGSSAGSIRVAKLKVGTTFDSVLPSLHVTVVGTNAIVTASDPTLGIQAATNILGPFADVSASTPYTNNISTNGATYFRFGQ